MSRCSVCLFSNGKCTYCTLKCDLLSTRYPNARIFTSLTGTVMETIYIDKVSETKNNVHTGTENN